MEQVLNGASSPLEIERWIIENGNKVFEKQTIYVNIPKGTDDTEIIMLKDLGNVVNEHCKGDVKIFIKVENDSGFRRHGLDLVLEKTISLKEALCGFSFDMKYINGKNYSINNQAGNIIVPDYQKLIPGMGLAREGHNTGNLIIHFKVTFPEKLNEEQIAKLREAL
jgi:DnaJ family protein A protein 2